MKWFGTLISLRMPAIEAIFGVILLSVGVSLVVSLGAALIVLGLVITVAAIWPAGWRR